MKTHTESATLNIPDGYAFEAHRVPKKGEEYLSQGDVYKAGHGDYVTPRIIIRKVKPKVADWIVLPLNWGRCGMLSVDTSKGISMAGIGDSFGVDGVKYCVTGYTNRADWADGLWENERPIMDNRVMMTHAICWRMDVLLNS